MLLPCNLLKWKIVCIGATKRQYLLQEGDVCKIQGICSKRLLRVYEVDVKEQEHIIAVCP